MESINCVFRKKKYRHILQSICRHEIVKKNIIMNALTFTASEVITDNGEDREDRSKAQEFMTELHRDKSNER